jgi:hypothetical protein
MLVYAPFALCFVYTSWRFYEFFRTNLFTRCHSASSLFSVVFVFQKSYTRNILGIGRNKSWSSPIFLTRDGVQSRDGGGPEGSRTIGWRGPPPGHATRWCGPLVHPLPLPFRLYILLDEKTLRAGTLFQKTYCNHRHCRCEIGRVQKLLPAPCRRGESPPEAFFIIMPAAGVMCE